MSDEQVTAVDADLIARARAAAAAHPDLEAALNRLDALEGIDLDQHPGEFDAVHRALRAALEDAGHTAPDVP